MRIKQGRAVRYAAFAYVPSKDTTAPSRRRVKNGKKGHKIVIKVKGH